MRTRSFVVWGVWKTHPETPTLSVCCTSKQLARSEKAKLEISTSTEHYIEQDNLLVHDGAHALTNAMYKRKDTI